MPVQGTCHAFQFVYSLCFLVLAKFENHYDLWKINDIIWLQMQTAKIVPTKTRSRS